MLNRNLACVALAFAAVGCSAAEPGRSGEVFGGFAATGGADPGGTGAEAEPTGGGGRRTRPTGGTTSPPWSSPAEGGTSATAGDDGSPAEEECVEGMRCYDPMAGEDDCGMQVLSSDIEEVERPGNLLIVYDRSGSMDEPWRGQPKYEAAGNAISQAIEPLQHLLTVGAVFFPSSEGCPCNVVDWTHWLPGGCCLNVFVATSCEVSSIGEVDQIDFRPAPEFITELPNQWRLQGAGQTPLQTAVQRAQEAIAANAFTDPLTIVIVTDGEPNCATNAATVLDQVTRWHDAGYPTYVVGLPGVGGAANLLNQLATAGGSGQFIDPGDPSVLQQQLHDILSDTVKIGIESCTINLTPPAEAPEKLQLIVEAEGRDQEVPRQFGNSGGWSVTDDGATVTLEGAICEGAKDGTYDRLRFEFGCKDLPPLEPPE